MTIATSQHINCNQFCVKYFTPDLDANLFTFFVLFIHAAQFALCARTLPFNRTGSSMFALINHQMLVIGLTLRVNISISDWQRVIYTITSKIDWYGIRVPYFSFISMCARVFALVILQIARKHKHCRCSVGGWCYSVAYFQCHIRTFYLILKWNRYGWAELFSTT